MDISSVNLMMISGAILLLFGVAACLYGAWQWQAYHRRQAWPTTQGKIIRSQLVGEGEDATADIEYEYHVAGVRYTSLNLVPENTGYTPSTMVERYIAGKPVTVYYNPDNPKQTLLERGNNILAIAFIGAGVIDIIFSAAYMLGFNVFAFLK